MIFPISADEVNDCLDFAKTVRQSEKQFGTSEEREQNQRIADTLTGKIAELALQKRLAQLGVTIAVDFAHYEETDSGQDIAAVQHSGQWQRCTCRVDSKGNAGPAQWLLVESHKFDSDYAHVYVMTKLLDIPKSRDLRKNPEMVRGTRCRAEVAGFAYREDFKDASNDFWFAFEQGKGLPKTSSLPERESVGAALEMKEGLSHLNEEDYLRVALDAKMNYSLPITWLRNTEDAWKGLAERLNKERAPLKEGFDRAFRMDAHNRIQNIRPLI